MRIKKITSQHRRDFWATMECEHCGHIEHDVSGYDDAYFHSDIIPKMKCKSCGKEAPETYKPRETKYPEDFII